MILINFDGTKIKYQYLITACNCETIQVSPGLKKYFFEETGFVWSLRYSKHWCCDSLLFTDNKDVFQWFSISSCCHIKADIYNLLKKI